MLGDYCPLGLVPHPAHRNWGSIDKQFARSLVKMFVETQYIKCEGAVPRMLPHVHLYGSF